MTNYADGLYLFRKEVLAEFIKQGYEIVVSLPYSENCKKIEELGCRLILTEFERRGNNPIQDFGLFLKYRRLLKQEKPDVVLTYTIKPNLYGGLASRLQKTPCIVNITGLGTALENGGLLSRILLWFYRLSTEKASCIFFQNSGNKQFMQEHGVALSQARLLAGSGVNLQEHEFVPYPAEETGLSFLAVIRIMKDKGIEEFLWAAKEIKEKYPFANFRLAGEYEKETRALYEPQIQALEAEGILEYLGQIDYVHQAMAESHVIVQPSYHEGMSNVLLEAAACGRPVLASDVPGCRETLLPGISGLTFAPRSREALSAAMETILNYTEGERASMGSQGRAHVEAVFDRNIVIQAYLEEIAKTM